MVGGMQPEDADKHRKDNSAHGVDPPAQFTAADGGEDTEAVDEEVVAVVFPEDSDLGDLVAEGPAIQEEGEFRAEGDDDGDDRREEEGARRGVGTLDQVADGEGDEDEGDGGHEEAEADVACCFNAGFPGGELAGVDAVDGLVAEEEGEVGAGVEDGVGHGGEEREGTRGDGGVELEDGEDDVGGERAVDGDAVAEGIVAVELARGADVFLDGFEHALDVLVLRLVEALQLARGHGVGYGIAAAEFDSCGRGGRGGGIPFARGVGYRLDLANLLGGFQLRGELEGIVFRRVPGRRLAFFITAWARAVLRGVWLCLLRGIKSCAGGCVQGQSRRGSVAGDVRV